VQSPARSLGCSSHIHFSSNGTVNSSHFKGAAPAPAQNCLVPFSINSYRPCFNEAAYPAAPQRRDSERRECSGKKARKSQRGD
jgi:hypothetical protein